MAEFLDFLYSHFPHRWLDKKAEGTKRLFTGLEKSIEYGANWVELVKRNHSIQTADELIPELENEYGLSINPSYDTAFRKRLIITRMRAQDSPITKMDLIQMLETLGLENCTIKNYHNEYRIAVHFRLPEDNQNRLVEAKNLLEENVRAHIAFYFNAIVESNVFNTNFVSFYRFIISISIQNLNIKTLYLNGERQLDGSWQLQTIADCIHLNRLKIELSNKNQTSCSQAVTFSVAIKNKFSVHTSLEIIESSSVKNTMKQSINFQQSSSLKETETTRSYLVMDTMWRLSGEVMLNGDKKINAQIIKITL